MVSKWVKVIHKFNCVERCVISYAKLGRCHVLSKDNSTSDYGGTLAAHCGYVAKCSVGITSSTTKQRIDADQVVCNIFCLIM